MLMLVGGLALAPLTAAVLIRLPSQAKVNRLWRLAEAWGQPRQFIGR
jgi:hypothetical protein